MDTLLPLVPLEAVQFVLVLLLSFFVGLEREEHKQRTADYAFGGVRTFPLIGLVSYALALVSGGVGLAWTVGFAAVGALMMLSYHHKLEASDKAGITTEVTGLTTYVLGALVHGQHYWIATTLAVVSVMLLELKQRLEDLTRKVELEEIVTLTKFLLLAVVILPVIPNREFSHFQINPFRTWLVVVAVSAISYASYLAQRVLRGRGGVLLTGLLGGAYSSTVTTVALARRARLAARPNLFSGTILAASGVMYARLALLLALFNRSLAASLAPAFVVLMAVGGVGGFLITLRRDPNATPDGQSSSPSKNPLQIQAALLFAILFVGVLVISNLVREYLGRAGLYTVAGVLGVADVDPFILGLTQASALLIPTHVAATAIVIAASSNNVAKGIYAMLFSDRATGLRSLAWLLGLAGLGLLPLLSISRP